jgi:hypothetical protein
MRNRLAFVVAVSVCLALAFTPLLAERTGRSADRTKSSPREVTVGSQDRLTIHPVVASTPLQFREGTADASVDTRAESYMAMAAAADDGQEAISYLMRAVTLGSQTGNEKLLTEAYLQLGDLYEGTASKQVDFYLGALQLTSEPALRSQLESRITALGGDFFDFAALPNVSTGASTHDVGPDDTCDGGDMVTMPWDEVMSITPSGDHNWRSFVVPEGIDGMTVIIETLSDDIYGDDTDLRLYGGCDAGTPTNFIAFNDDGGPGFLSLIEAECLVPGTYYVEIGGYGDVATPSDFNFLVTDGGVCVNPVYPEAPDGYEPDDLRSEANGIGNPTSTPPHSNGWGRAKSEIQDHVIYPAGDMDHVKFEVTRSELVRAGVATEFPTFFNDFTSVPFGNMYDSYIELLYGVEPSYGGLCNDPAIGFGPFCRTDEDCPPPTGAPLPGYPACIPIYNFTFGGSTYWWPYNPIAFNEDRNFSDYGSEVVVCLPRSDQQTPSLTANGDWVLRVMSSPLYDPDGTFYYQVQVKNEVQCNFELEPNNGPFGANPIELGGVYHGFQETSEFLGTVDPWDWFTTDPDWLAFDVETDSIVTFETDGYDIYWCDTFLQMYVGPDDFGGYYILSNLSDDDGGPGYLSYLSALLPPADALLGNTVADANYFLDVTTQYPVPNFPWALYTSVEPFVPPSFDEIEPNDTCDAANEALLGDTLTAAIDPACDYDAFSLSLAEDTYVVFETDGGDTTIKLTNADEDYLGCDDDGGPGLASRIEGCLPAGDYCLRVRAYSSTGTIGEYELSVTDTGSCVPMDPPVTISDELYRCDNAQEPDEFDNCPNVLGD